VDWASLGFTEEELNTLLSEDDAAVLKPLTVVRPIQRVWVLLGIPAEKYPEVAATLDGLGSKEGVFYDSTIR